MSQLKIVLSISKGSSLTGNAWVDVLLGGEKLIDSAEITANYDVDPNAVVADKLELISEYDGASHLTLTVLNRPETIGPIQIYTVEFFLDDNPLNLNWQTAIKGKPMRFGGQPNITITNPHLHDENFSAWCSVPDVSPGMSITWGLHDLVNQNTNI